MRMIAKTKFNYGTRRLLAGDHFEASKPDRDLMVPLGLAHELPDEETESIRAFFVGISADPEHWREQYRLIYGRLPDGRWSIKRIRDEINKSGKNP